MIVVPMQGLHMARTLRIEIYLVIDGVKDFPSIG